MKNEILFYFFLYDHLFGSNNLKRNIPWILYLKKMLIIFLNFGQLPTFLKYFYLYEVTLMDNHRLDS